MITCAADPTANRPKHYRRTLMIKLGNVSTETKSVKVGTPDMPPHGVSI